MLMNMRVAGQIAPIMMTTETLAYHWDELYAFKYS